MKSVLFFIIPFLVSNLFAIEKSNLNIEIKKGEVNLQSKTFDDQSIYKLKGEWSFYWKKWIDPKDIVEKKIPLPTEYVKVPGLWNQYKFKENNKKLRFGFGSYLLKIKGLYSKQKLGLYLRTFSSNYKLYLIDGNEVSVIGSVGKIGKDRRTSIPSDESKVYPFNPKNDVVYLLIHCSNFSYRSGGFFSPFHLGKEKVLRTNLEQTIYKHFLSIGVFIIMGLYHFGLFSLRKKDKASLWFGLFCIFMFLRKFSESDYIFKFFSDSIFLFNWNVTFEYFSLFLSGPIFAKFLGEIFQFKFFKYYIRLWWIIGLTYTLGTTFTPAYLFTRKMVLISHNLIFAVFMLVGIGIILNAIRTKQKYSGICLLGIVILVFGVVYDNLILLHIVPPPFIVTYTFIVFIFMQSYILATKFAYAFETAERLSKDLEKEVQIRTKEAVDERIRAEESERNVKSLLDNMKQSVFTINGKAMVQDPVSKWSSEIFSEDIVDKSVYQTIFKGIKEKSEQHSEIEFVFSTCFDSDMLQWDIMEGQLPPKIIYQKNESSDEKILRVSYSPLLNSDENVQKIMFIAEDVTEIEHLEKEMKDQKDASSKKTTILQELSQSPKDDLSLFFTNSYNLIEEAVEKAKAIRTHSDRPNKSEYEVLFRNLHTLKGNSRVFSLGFISTIVHEVETDGLELKEVIQTFDEKTQNSSINEFIQKLYGIQGQINEYIKIGKEVFNFEFEDDKKIKGNLNDLFMNFEFYLSDILPKGLKEFNKEDSSDGEKILQPLSDDLYYQISINLHSQKGLAKSIGEKDISGPLHSLESQIENIKKDSETFNALKDELFKNINSIHHSILKLYIQSSIFVPIDLDKEHFVLYLERLFNFTQFLLGKNEDQIDLRENGDLYSMYTYGNNKQINYLNFLTKKMMSTNERSQILYYVKSLWDYTSWIISLDMIKHSHNNQREKLEDGFPQDKEIYAELHGLFLVKFLNLYSKNDIVKTFEQLFGDTFNFKHYFIPSKSSSKILNETFLTLKNNPTFFNLAQILEVSKREGKDFMLEKMKTILEENSVFFHSKLVDVLQILFFYSDLGSERDALSGPQLVEVIKENYSKFYEKFKILIAKDQTDEAVMVGKYFRDLLDLPVKYSFNRFRTVVTEVSKSLGKKINFKLSGDQCSLNKENLNLLHDAMVHLVRNSLDHGIESPEVRSQNNKDVEGTLEIKCSHLGEDKIIIVLQDDGGGINPDIISEKIVSKGLRTKEEVSKMSVEEKLNLIFLPGFSTKDHATEISGRGVGMDVVKQNLKIIGAVVKVESEVKKGTRFIIEIDKTRLKVG